MKLVKLMAILVATAFFVAGCGGSDSSDSTISDPDRPSTFLPFTSDMLVGKTYRLTDGDDIVTFSETTITVNGGEVLNYTIEDGVLIIDGDDYHYLISIENGGDTLIVKNDGEDSTWIITNSTTAPTLKFTSDMLVGKTYQLTDGNDRVTFSETTITVNGSEVLNYTIEDGVLIIDGDDYHYLKEIQNDGNTLIVENDGDNSTWNLVS
jgi:hypothetical protein